MAVIHAIARSAGITAAGAVIDYCRGFHDTFGDRIFLNEFHGGERTIIMRFSFKSG